MQVLAAGVRRIRNSPRLSAMVLLCFTLGLGASTAIFAVVNAVLLRRIPFPAPEQLARITEVRNDLGHDQAPFEVTPLTYEELQAQMHLLASLAAFKLESFNGTGAGEPERFEGAAASASLATVLGVRPQLGRFFAAEEDRPGNGDRVVVLAHALWSRRFGADPAVVGRTLGLNGEPYTIVGVMPAGGGFPAQAELWVPLALDVQQMPERTKRTLTVLARLHPQAAVERAVAELTGLGRRMERDFPDSHAGWGLRLTPLREDLVSSLRPILLLLWATVAFVLLITCANVAGLLLTRATAEGHELATRAALGASRRRLTLESLAYVCVLALLGTVLGGVLAIVLVPALIRLSGVEISAFHQVSVDDRVFGYALLVTVVAALLAGLFPALQASRLDLYGILRDSSRGASGARRAHRLQRLLVVAEVALAVVLSSSALLMLRSFYELTKVELGFRTQDVLTFAIFPPAASYPERHHKVAFFERALEAIRAIPGVSSAGASSTLPLSAEPVVARFSVEGRPPASRDEVLQATHRRISAGYLEAMGIAVVEGEGLRSPADEQAAAGVIVSRELARRYWPGQPVLGRRLKRGAPDSDKPWMTVVGVAEDVQDLEIDGEVAPTWYLPYAQHDFTTMSVAVHTRRDPAEILSEVRAAVQRIDRALPLYDVATTAEIASRSLASQRTTAILLGAFAVFALLLSSLGVYGVTASGVSQRVQELGVRRCLGAGSGDVLKLVLGETLLLAFAGLALGLAGAIAASKLLATLLYRVQPSDPGVLLATAAILATVTLAAGLGPARRAAGVDPLVAVRGSTPGA